MALTTPLWTWPIEEAPEWKALGNAGKGWLDFCNYLLNPQPAEGEVTLADVRRELRPLLDLSIELVLVSHGEPILEGGRDELAQALDT